MPEMPRCRAQTMVRVQGAWRYVHVADRQKRKVAIFFGYCGSEYSGLQVYVSLLLSLIHI